MQVSKHVRDVVGTVQVRLGNARNVGFDVRCDGPGDSFVNGNTVMEAVNGLSGETLLRFAADSRGDGTYPVLKMADFLEDVKDFPDLSEQFAFVVAVNSDYLPAVGGDRNYCEFQPDNYAALAAIEYLKKCGYTPDKDLFISETCRASDDQEVHNTYMDLEDNIREYVEHDSTRYIARYGLQEEQRPMTLDTQVSWSYAKSEDIRNGTYEEYLNDTTPGKGNCFRMDDIVNKSYMDNIVIVPIGVGYLPMNKQFLDLHPMSCKNGLLSEIAELTCNKLDVRDAIKNAYLRDGYDGIIDQCDLFGLDRSGAVKIADAEVRNHAYAYAKQYGISEIAVAHILDECKHGRTLAERDGTNLVVNTVFGGIVNTLDSKIRITEPLFKICAHAENEPGGLTIVNKYSRELTYIGTPEMVAATELKGRPSDKPGELHMLFDSEAELNEAVKRIQEAYDKIYLGLDFNRSNPISKNEMIVNAIRNQQELEHISVLTVPETDVKEANALAERLYEAYSHPEVLPNSMVTDKGENIRRSDRAIIIDGTHVGHYFGPKAAADDIVRGMPEGSCRSVEYNDSIAHVMFHVNPEDREGLEDIEQFINYEESMQTDARDTDTADNPDRD